MFFTMLVLFVFVLAYSLVGYHVLAENDPFHFGTYALSVLTFFQLFTFENWITIYYINYGGCDSYAYLNDYFPPSHPHNSPESHSHMVETIFGSFHVPECKHPHAQPVASSLIFVSYIIFVDYLLVKMCLSAVFIGINERLEDLRNVSLYGESGDEDFKHSTRNLGHGSKASKLLGNNA